MGEDFNWTVLSQFIVLPLFSTINLLKPKQNTNTDMEHPIQSTGENKDQDNTQGFNVVRQIAYVHGEEQQDVSL